jgi:hypothetical protein
MPSQTDICNAAISHCGTRSKISSISEGSPEANACLTHYPFVLAASLRSYDWNFARKTVQLGMLALPIPAGQTVAPTSNVARWSYEFVLPTDIVYLRRLNDLPIVSNPQQWFELASDIDGNNAPINVLFCNLPAVSALYTALIADPNRWDAGFVDAMQYGLAERICYELSAKEDRVKSLTGMWAQTLSIAAVQAANENPDPAPAYVPEMAQARGYDDGLAATGQAWPSRSF